MLTDIHPWLRDNYHKPGSQPGTTGGTDMNIEDILLVIALVVAFAIVGTMDSQDAELSASTTHPTLQQQVTQ